MASHSTPIATSPSSSQNWGTVSKPVTKWAKDHINKMYTNTLSHHTQWKRISGIPIAIAHGGFNLIAVTSLVAEPIITFGAGLKNIFGAPFSKNCKVLPGIGQLIASIGQAACVLIHVPYVILAHAIGLIAIPILMLIVPDQTCEKILGGWCYLDFVKEGLYTIEAIMADTFMSMQQV